MRTISLPADLCMLAEEKFGSLEPLLERVLRNLLSDDASQADEGEQRVIEQRLRDLGYL
jgi:hypothetical protein